MYKFLCGHIFSFLLDVHLEAELLDHREILYLWFQPSKTDFLRPWGVLMGKEGVRDSLFQFPGSEAQAHPSPLFICRIPGSAVP
jgi:hypothetical protein